MNTSPENNQEKSGQETPLSNKQPSSFLGNFIASDVSTSTQDDSLLLSNQQNIPKNIKKVREPLSMTTILKAIGALLTVAVIFFGSFLAYIVFHPEQAYFFVNIFGINPSDIATILKKLINISFGAIIFLISVSWIILLFRAIWTPRELKRKKLLGWMTAVLVGVILFGILTFWAYLFSKLAKIDFTNLTGTVLIYDSELFSYPATKDISRLKSTTNIIGPISLKFDISENARQTQLHNSVKITKYSIDFNGAKCSNGLSMVSGTNPLEEEGIVCVFDITKNYNISGIYTATDLLGKEVSVPIDIPPVEIR